MDQLTRRRLEASDDNKKDKPLSVLELALDDIKRGEIKLDGLYVICIDRSQPIIKTSVYRAGLSWEEQIAYLQLQIATIAKWKLED